MRPVLPLVLLLAAPALAADSVPTQKPVTSKRLKGDMKVQPSLVPKLDLGGLGTVPKGEGMRAEASTAAAPSGPARPAEVRYDVLSVVHARSLVPGPGGAMVPRTAPLAAVALTPGKPPTLERFSTVLRVRSAARQPASLDVAVLDNRGDTAMTASGTLTFRGTGKAEGDDVAEYVIDWSPTPARGPGHFQVLVRVAGQALGTFPLRVEPEAP
jgi:hypothetical protein